MTSRHTVRILKPQIPRRLPQAGLAHLEDGLEISSTSIRGADLAGQQASRVVLELVSLRQVSLQGSRIIGLRLTDVRMESCDGSGAVWDEARLRRVEMVGCRLQGLQMPGAEWADVSVVEGNLREAFLGAAKFTSARFENCNLSQVNFEGCDLTGVGFFRCDLTGADLRGACLQDTDFRTSNLSAVQVGVKEMRGAIIEPGQASQVIALLGVRVMEAEAKEGDVDDPSRV